MTTVVTPEPIARPLRDRRAAAGLTRMELCVLANCSIASLQNFEAGLTPANSPTLRRVLYVLEAHEAAAAAREAALTHEGPAANGTSVENTAGVSPADYEQA